VRWASLVSAGEEPRLFAGEVADLSCDPSMLVFASGWRGPMAVSAITGLQAWGAWGLARLSRRRQDAAGTSCGALRYNSGVAEEGGHGSGPLMPVKLDDRAVPYTVPMKAVHAQRGPLGRSAQLPTPRRLRKIAKNHVVSGSLVLANKVPAVIDV
jgi:hypothetical protein